MQDTATNKGVGNAEVESIQGVNVGRGARTDSTGAYRLDGLAPGSMTMRVSADGYPTQTASVSLSGNQALNFTLSPPQPPPLPVQYQYSGVVHDSTGLPIRGVNVLWRVSDSAPFNRVDTDGNGGFSFSSTTQSQPVYFDPPAGYDISYVYSQGFNTAYRLSHPGAYDVTLRRVYMIALTNVPPTVHADGTSHSAQSYNMMCHVVFDDGQTLDSLATHTFAINPFLESSNSGVLAVDNSYTSIEGVAAGNAQLRCGLWARDSDWVPVQVVP